MAQATSVRRIRVGEGMKWRALRLRALADTPIAFVETVEQASAFPDSQWRDAAARHAAGCQSALFVAERGNEWVGVAGGFARDDRSTTVFTAFIEPAARGQRLLEPLEAAVAEWSRWCGRETLLLEVAIQNPRALAAYKRLGFTTTGNSVTHPLYPEITDVEMTRPAVPAGSGNQAGAADGR